MNDIRREVSDLFGFVILTGKWMETFKRLETEGRLGQKQVHEILALLLEREEKREKGGVKT